MVLNITDENNIFLKIEQADLYRYSSEQDFLKKYSIHIISKSAILRKYSDFHLTKQIIAASEILQMNKFLEK